MTPVPIHSVGRDDLDHMFFDVEERSQALAHYYEEVANRYQIEYLNPGSAIETNELDGIHYSCLLYTSRAFLSPWYERGGMYPADDKDTPVFVGRFNIGAVSLHLPMILAKARAESRDFYEVLDFYLQMIRNLHIRTYEYLGQMRASTNPLAYCEGGFYGGHLKPNEKIGKLLKPMTASFGITALNELQELYNGKSIREDGQFALEVLKYINDKVNQFKQEDGYPVSYTHLDVYKRQTLDYLENVKTKNIILIKVKLGK